MQKIHSCLDRIKNKELKTYFQKKKKLSRQPPNLSKLLTAKFERLAIPKEVKQVALLLALTASIIKMIILKNIYLADFAQ